MSKPLERRCHAPDPTRSPPRSWIRWLAMICQAGADSGIAAEQIVTWAETAETTQLDAWTVRQIAFGLYRAGQDEKALALLKKGDPQSIHDTVFLAMLYQRTGRSKENRKFYESACRRLAAATPKDAHTPAAMIPPHWIYAHVLQREADRLLNSGKPAAHPTAEPGEVKKPL